MAGGRRLTARQRAEVRQALAQCREMQLGRRLLALLDVDEGRPIVEVARRLQVTRRSVHGWVHAYHSRGGVEALVDRPRSGRPSRWDGGLRTQLETWLEQSPQAYAYPATVWTVPLLQEQFRNACGQEIAEKTLRRELHAMGYSWKRARYLLAPDPERGEKAAPPAGAPDAPGATECDSGAG
jgi:transposase